MTWWTTYTVNTSSGMLLAALGIVALLKARSKALFALGFFLVVWGAQLILTNSAAGTEDADLAFALFRLGHLLVPLQAVLLLFYVSQRVTEASSSARTRRIYRVAKVAALLLALWAVVGMTVALVNDSAVFQVHEEPQGTSFDTGAWAPVFFSGPRFVGVELALLLLGLHVASRPQAGKDWCLLVGLGTAWAYTLGYNGVLEAYDIQSPALLGFFIVAAGLAVYGAVQWFLTARRGNPAQPLLNVLGPALILLVGSASWLVHPTSSESPAWVWIAPGTVRILAIVALAPAVWRHEAHTAEPKPRAPWSRGIAAAAITAVLFAGTLFLHNNAHPTQDPVWPDLTRSMAMLGAAVVAVLGVLQLRPLVMPPMLGPSIVAAKAGKKRVASREAPIVVEKQA